MINDLNGIITDHVITERFHPFCWGIRIVVGRALPVSFHQGPGGAEMTLSWTVSQNRVTLPMQALRKQNVTRFYVRSNQRPKPNRIFENSVQLSRIEKNRTTRQRKVCRTESDGTENQIEATTSNPALTNVRSAASPTLVINHIDFRDSFQSKFPIRPHEYFPIPGQVATEWYHNLSQARRIKGYQFF